MEWCENDRLTEEGLDFTLDGWQAVVVEVYVGDDKVVVLFVTMSPLVMVGNGGIPINAW